jgi:hypothetical protein
MMGVIEEVLKKMRLHVQASPVVISFRSVVPEGKP